MRAGILPKEDLRIFIRSNIEKDSGETFVESTLVRQ